MTIIRLIRLRSFMNHFDETKTSRDPRLIRLRSSETHFHENGTVGFKVIRFDRTVTI